jgi:ADP-heptose:LPS heptosyltransferase
LESLAHLYKWHFRFRQQSAGWFQRIIYSHTSSDVKYDQQPSKVLLVMTGLIGDTVMSTPVIVEARRLWPEAEIVLLGTKQNLALLENCPLLNSSHLTSASPYSIRSRKENGKLKRWLAESGFDLAIILLGDDYAQVLADVAIPVRVGVSGHWLEPFLTHNYEIKSPREWGPNERLNSLRCLGLQVENTLPKLWVTDEMRDQAKSRLAQLGLPVGQAYVVIHPFGSTLRQWWQLDKAETLVRRLQSECGMTTVLAGGPETKDHIPEPLAGLVINTTGKLTIQELLGVIEGSRLAISTDSGPFHIAGALGRPVVGLFRARRPEHAGHYPQARVLFGRDDRCQQPCAWDKCAASPCRQLSRLRADEVFETVCEMLTENRLGRSVR